jgi:hypothetical protein
MCQKIKMDILGEVNRSKIAHIGSIDKIKSEIVAKI